VSANRSAAEARPRRAIQAARSRSLPTPAHPDRRPDRYGLHRPPYAMSPS